MQRFTRIVTALLLAAHAIAGCCAHHACGEGIVGGHIHAMQTTHSLGVVAEFADESASHESSHECPAPRQPCDHDKCTYVVASAVRVDLGVGSCLGTAATLVAPSLPAVSESAAATQHNCRTTSVRPSIYVCYCALLI